MPIKKSTTGKAQAKTVSKPKVAVKSVVSNEALRSEIAELKKQIEALSSRMKMFMYAEETHKKNASDNLEALKQFIEK